MTLAKADDAGDSEDLQALFDTIAAETRPVVPPPPEPDASGDNDDLQALFDTVAAEAATPEPAPPPPPPPPAAAVDATGDNADLQALFDSVVADTAVAPVSPATPAGTPPADSAGGDPGGHSDEIVFNRLGHLARELHDSLRELGYDRMLEDAAQSIPDARQRLSYIAQMTEQAASRVLNATDIAQPIQDDLSARAEALAGRWDRMFANQLSVDEFKQLAADTRGYFVDAPAKHKATSAQLTEIMMAQDFQDLTGQVIKKVVELADNLERQMLAVLIEVMPEAKKAAAPEGLMNGPVMDPSCGDVVNSQAQVDDLLESLGF